MRHLHTPAGAKDPDLTPEGKRYAERLAEQLPSAGLTAVYVSATKRAQQTAASLAKRHKIVPKIYDPADSQGVVAAALQEPGTVLIVGHSNTVPNIVVLLGGQRPRDLAHEDFGDLWQISGASRLTKRTKLLE